MSRGKFASMTAVEHYTPILKTSTVALVGAALVGGLITARALTRR
jgi:hypothetical protein